MKNEIFFNDFKFVNDKNYLSGHRRENNFEGLFEHSKKVLDFFKKFVNERQIKFNFEGLSVEKSKKLINYLEKIIFLHDIGKVNSHTQKYFLGELDSSLETSHSDISFIITLLYFYGDIIVLKDNRLDNQNRKETHIFTEYLISFIYAIYFHHSSLFNYSNITQDIQDKVLIKIKYPIRNIFKTKEKTLEEVINIFPKDWNFEDKLLKLKRYFNKDILNNSEKTSLFFNLKLFYSLLVMSDYYATYSYQFNRSLNEIKINQIDEKLLSRMEDNFYKINYNKDLKERKLKSLDDCKNINDLRNNLIVQSSQTLKKEINNSKVFMLNVPTGGGKTNISLKLALDILKLDKSVGRINWVFPFVNIIEQNYKIIKDTYFANENYRDSLSQIYNDSINFEILENVENYEDNKIKIMEKDLNLAYLNNPINIISNVNFFNALLKVKSQNRYKFANFTNSIVIIDEIQSLDSNYIDIFYRLLEIISKQHNIYFIIMSATLPNINNFIERKIAVNLIKNYKNYFNNKIFRRNNYYFVEEVFDEDKLLRFLEKIIKENTQVKKVLIVLNTIKSSINIFQKVKDKFKNFDVLLLNSFIQKNDRQKLINFIKNSEEKLILISTQSIETGVDLDFDLGVRDKSLIDSIEQIAGRINRECNPNKKGKLYLINYNNESIIYKKEDRFKLLGKEISFSEEKSILENKNFEIYYNKWFNKIKQDQELALRKKPILEVYNLNFKKLSKLNIIESKFSLRLIFDEINKEDYENIKGVNKTIDKVKSVYELFNLIKEKNEFHYLPLKRLVNKLVNKNSLQINFFFEKELNKFKSLLMSEFNAKEFGNNLVVSKNFRKRYFKEYTIKEKKFSYFDWGILKEDLKNYLDSKDFMQV